MPTLEDVTGHNSRESCWVIISNQVYNLTTFLDSHPGGPAIILRYAGKDATSMFNSVHPPGTLDTLSGGELLGPLTTSGDEKPQKNNQLGNENVELKLPHLHTLQNLDDFEKAAKMTLTKGAWVYFSSAADELYALKRNRRDFARVYLRPRALRNVAKVSLRRNVMGHASSLPIFIAPAAVAKLGHVDGELCLVRGASRHNIVYGVSTYSSISHADISTCFETEKRETRNLRFGNGALAFQLYLPKRKIEGGRELISRAKSLGYNALIITVDTAVVGKREEDERNKAELEIEDGLEVEFQRPDEPGGDTPVLRGAHSSTVTWDDITWIRKAWGQGPIIIKGIQTVEDAFQASKCGVQGIYLSNHGGRQLDHSPSSIQTLLEINQFCPEVLDRLEIYLDGGVRRGTDVIKALCLGATAVGLGRPFMYALSAYGTDGVLKAIQILSDEIETALRLLGVTDLAHLNKTFINTANLERSLPSLSNLGEDILSRQGKL